MHLWPKRFINFKRRATHALCYLSKLLALSKCKSFLFLFCIISNQDIRILLSHPFFTFLISFHFSTCLKKKRKKKRKESRTCLVFILFLQKVLWSEHDTRTFNLVCVWHFLSSSFVHSTVVHILTFGQTLRQHETRLAERQSVQSSCFAVTQSLCGREYNIATLRTDTLPWRRAAENF